MIGAGFESKDENGDVTFFDMISTWTSEMWPVLTLATFITAGDFRGQESASNNKTIEMLVFDIATD